MWQTWLKKEVNEFSLTQTIRVESTGELQSSFWQSETTASSCSSLLLPAPPSCSSSAPLPDSSHWIKLRNSTRTDCTFFLCLLQETQQTEKVRNNISIIIIVWKHLFGQAGNSQCVYFMPAGHQAASKNATRRHAWSLKVHEQEAELPVQQLFYHIKIFTCSFHWKSSFLSAVLVCVYFSNFKEVCRIQTVL